jgi:hypothetical protein
MPGTIRIESRAVNEQWPVRAAVDRPLRRR